ncbi:unnamed protein product [Knipowitschia caucasica]|uniref:Uncharacterized protein n=1 Tax=Knipowitschia caucasica TaxID=637954 RepID=A0AAV2KN08_KNICA
MLLLLLSALVLMSLVLLTSLCLRCGRKSMVSIRQSRPSEDTYIPSTQFLVNSHMQCSRDQNYVHPASNLLSPLFSADGNQRPGRPSSTPTETESNNSYENAESCVCEDHPDSGYVEVLPETAPPEGSDSEVNNDYENTEEEEPNYVNVETDQSQVYALSCDQLLTNYCPDSDSSEDEDEDDDEDDDEADYVNQPW